MTPDLDHESERLAALRAFGVLDTDPERVFDELVQIAATVCSTPMAAISLVDEHRQWWKARLGTDVCSTDRDVAFCDHVVRSGRPLVVGDARTDDRFLANPLVTGGPRIRSYAGSPLVTGEGFVLGSLCVLDHVPRQFSERQLELLGSLARRVMRLLEGRQVAEELADHIATSSLLQRQLERVSRFQQAVLESVSSAVTVVDENGARVMSNRASGAPGGDAPPPEWIQEALAGRELEDELVRVDRDGRGELRDIRMTTRRLSDADGRLLGAVGVGTDVTDLRRAQAELRERLGFTQAVLAASPHLTFLVDLASRRFTWSSSNAFEVLGHDTAALSEVVESLVDFLVHPDDAEMMIDLHRRAAGLADGAVLEVRYRARHGDGNWHWMSQRITPFRRGADGRVIEALGIARDITDLVDAEQGLRTAALHDSLTGLPNRLLLADRIESAQARVRRRRIPFALLMCDLDGFKAVNDAAGHEAGDAVLAEVARRVRAVVRAQDTVARVGGDEFVILVEAEPAAAAGAASAAESHRIEDEVGMVAARVRAALEDPVVVGGTAFRVGVSIGSAYADAGSHVESVIGEADRDMYLHKHAAAAARVAGEPHLR